MYYMKHELSAENPRKKRIFNDSTALNDPNTTREFISNLANSLRTSNTQNHSTEQPTDIQRRMDRQRIDNLSQKLVNAKDFLHLFDNAQIKNKKMSIDRLYE